MKGWKTLLGGILKTAGGGALAAVLPHLGDVASGLATSGNKYGAIAAVLLMVGGDALQKIGLGHKLDRAEQAIKEAK